MKTRKLKIGLLGCGTVGRGLAELISRNDSLIRQRSGVSCGYGVGQKRIGLPPGSDADAERTA